MSIYQTDAEFPPDIRSYGCYFLSLLFQLDRLFSLGIMDHKIIQAIYEAESKDFDLGPECYISNPKGLANHVARGKTDFLGRFDRFYVCRENEFEVCRWFNPNTDFGHFVAGDGKGNVIYDPIEGGSRTVREGYLESKRIFQVI
jgi:hypothetical protein